MKILPEYLIQYMPEVEAAIEELRLSVIDHAYEMLMCLDVDELTSDEIRQKLDISGIKVENMTEAWLPNGRFYRMYPSIKHHRTRRNAIQSIVKSGGQFEGVWSNDFSSKIESNYNSIQLLRHYELSLPYDGYFYISGDTSRAEDGTVTSDAIAALQSDILLSNALPAGYTYLYVPWPRPVYPDSSGYFYNVHMLQFDRLHYPTWGTHNNYNENIPTSEQYRYDYGAGTPYRTPYWFDYHYAENTYYTESPIYKKYDSESKTWKRCYYEHIEDYYPAYEKLVDGEWVTDNGYHWPISSATTYESSPAVLSNSNSVLPTTFYGILVGKTSSPVVDTANSFTYYYYNRESSSDDKVENTTCYLDEGLPCWPDYSCSKEYGDAEFGPYRFDVLSGYRHFTLDSMNHIKTYKPVWSEESPVFEMMQSNSSDALHPNEIVSRSLYNWFESKQQNNILFPENSTIANNEPPISEITHTSLDRPTYCRINDGTIIAYFLPFSSDQGNNKYLYPAGSYSFYNKLYYFSNDYFIEVDPNKTYSVDSLAVVNNNDIIIYNMKEYDTVPILGMDISNDGLCLDLNGFNAEYGSYVIFREKETFKTHKFWFSDTHDPLVLDTDDTKVYHEMPDEWKAEYSYSNNKSFAVDILGIYDENDEKVYYENDATIELALNGSTSNYEWLTSKFGSYSSDVIATFTIDLNDSWMRVDDSNVRPDYSEPDIFSEMSDTHYIFRSYSNAGVDSSEASIYIYVNVTFPCSLSFKVNNDSERPGNTPPDPPSPSSWDYTKVYVDNNLHTDCHNEVSWVDCEVEFTTTGIHTIKVSYIKDSSQSAYSDCGYLALSKTFTNIGTMSGEIYGEIFTPVAASYAICKLRKVNTPARYI